MLMIRAEAAASVPREERGPGFGEHLVPQAGPWCEVCSFMGWRNGSGHFARAAVALQTQRDGRILACGNCTARIRKKFPAEVLSARKLTKSAGAASHRDGVPSRGTTTAGGPVRVVRAAGGNRAVPAVHATRAGDPVDGVVTRGTAAAG
jgi:hypothetical protein